MQTKSIIFPNGTKLNFHGNDNLMKAIDLSFPFIEEYTPKKIIREANIVYDGLIKKTVNIPPNAERIKGFAGPCYFVWQSKDGITSSYSPESERRGSHFVRNNGSDFVVRIHNNENEEILCRIARDIILRDILNEQYFPIHASVVKTNENAEIFFGKRGSGKSTALFSSVLFDNSIPMSGDVAFIKQNGKTWEVLGWPWRVSVDTNYFSVAHKDVDFKYEERGKLRFMPSDFCNIFGTKWAWKAKIGKLTKTNLIVGETPSIKNLLPSNLEFYLEHEGKDNWLWGDSLKIGIKKPIFYNGALSSSVPGKILSGNIVSYYKERNVTSRTLLNGRDYGY